MFVSAYSAQFSSYSLASAGGSLLQPTTSEVSGSQALPATGVNVTLSHASLTRLEYTSTASAESTQPPAVEAIEGADERVNAAAGTIVSFIGQRLALDVADGATQEELQSRLQAGLEGFLKGFGEASEQLQGLGQLSPELALEIQATFDRVIEGIDALSQQYLDDEYQLDLTAYKGDATEASAPEPAPVASAETAGIVNQPAALTYDAPSLKAKAQLSILKSLDVVADIQQQVAEKAAENKRAEKEQQASQRGGFEPQQVRGSLSYQELQARSFSFQLTTEEGDVVTISASSASAYSAAARYHYGQSATGNSSGQLQYREQSLQGQQFSFSIEGELSEDELAAINDLLSDVTDLASVFYSGDVEGAFEQAVALGYDDEQIASFSLNLTQVSVQKATQQYGAHQSNNNGLGRTLAPVGEFVKGLQSALETIKQFDDQRQLLLSLLNQAAVPYEPSTEADVPASESPASSVADFVARLLDQNLLAA